MGDLKRTVLPLMLLGVNLHGYQLKMKIWDTAGQERFKSMSVQVIKNSDAVILVYAINDINSFKALDQWLNKLNETTDLNKKPIIIVGNKADLPEDQRVVTYEEGKNYASSKGYRFYETSAKTKQNIEDAFNDIFEQLYQTFEEEITGKKPVNQGMKIRNKERRRNCC